MRSPLGKLTTTKDAMSNPKNFECNRMISGEVEIKHKGGKTRIVPFPTYSFLAGRGHLPALTNDFYTIRNMQKGSK